METITIIILTISILFFILLGVKELFSKKIKNKICIICLSITLTWMTLLVLLYLNILNNKIIIALLLGQTTLGIFYFIEKKVKEKLKIFRLPFLLTLIIIAYSLIELTLSLSVLSLIITLWTIFILIYLFQNNRKANSFVNKLIECCKKW